MSAGCHLPIPTSGSIAKRCVQNDAWVARIRLQIKEMTLQLQILESQIENPQQLREYLGYADFYAVQKKMLQERNLEAMDRVRAMIKVMFYNMMPLPTWQPPVRPVNPGNAPPLPPDWPEHA